MNILALNCGSSSLKYQLFDWNRHEKLASGLVDRIGQPGSLIKHQVGDAPAKKLEMTLENHTAAIEKVIALLFEVLPKGAKIHAVGHRLVHGGDRFARSVVINSEVIETIENLIPLAPLHNPANLAGIRAAQKLMPGVTQVAVFDTAFHQTMPTSAYTYAVPQDWAEKYGVRRYGFHGTSHLYVSRKVAGMLNRSVRDLRIITCHIGNGGSVTAVKYGQSVDTSMGLTPLAGVVMGTRSGDCDPGMIPYLQTQTKMTYEQVFDCLNKKSGMIGMTGSNDLRDIEARHHEGDARCTAALKVYAYSLKKYIGAYAAAMNGVDAIVFTAGVGENSSLIREMTLQDMQYLGVYLDTKLNQAAIRGGEGVITQAGSPVKVAVVATNEEQVIIEDTVTLLEGRSPLDAGFHYSFERAEIPSVGAPKADPASPTIPVAVSNRHLHVSRKDLDALFGPGYRLTPLRPLSQPGQFAAVECIQIVGPKGRIENVRILGPERKATQVEVSQTDAYKLGVEVPVRDSGDIVGSGKLLLVGPKGEVEINEGVIIAWRHIHMHTSDAPRFGVKDKDMVSVRTCGERSITFENVLIRVNEAFALEMHIDTDEANAALLHNGDCAMLVKGELKATISDASDTAKTAVAQEAALPA